jgi:hypothetical protein
MNLQVKLLLEVALHLFYTGFYLNKYFFVEILKLKIKMFIVEKAE